MKIYLSSKANKQLRKIPSSMYNLIFEEIKDLEENPFPGGAKKLSGRDGWRIRIGDYRILYTADVKKKELTVLSVGHRKEVYRY